MGAQKKLSATEWALQQLAAGRSITHPDAILSGHGWRLAARVYDLREAGFQIVTRRGRRGIGVYTLKDDRQGELFGGGAAGPAPDTASMIDPEGNHDPR